MSDDDDDDDADEGWPQAHPWPQSTYPSIYPLFLCGSWLINLLNYPCYVSPSLSLSLSPVFYYYLSLSREILQVPHSFGVSLTLNCCHVSHIKYVDSGIV